MNVVEAAVYIDWWGSGDNCLRVPTQDRGPTGLSYGPGSKLAMAGAICAAAPPLLTLDGPRGPGRIIAVVPTSRVAFVNSQDGHCCLLPAEVGGFSRQSVGQFRLKGGSPSQWIRGLYTGGAFALTPKDAEAIGFLGPIGRGLPSWTEAVLFGSNVEDR